MGNGRTGVLGAITRVLVVALVAVVTAWIISCVYTKRFVLISLISIVRSQYIIIGHAATPPNHRPIQLPQY